VSGSVRLLDLGVVSPLRSQALYHALAERMEEGGPDTIVLCRPATPYFSVGYHQAPEEVLDLAWCRARGYPVIRRRIGGGAVYLDRGQLFYQVIVHRRRAPFDVAGIYRRFLSPAVRTLRRLGLPAELTGVNEIEVAGRRAAGTGGGQLGEAVVVVGNFLFDFPPRVMARAWRVPSPAFRRLALDGLRRHLGTLEAAPGGLPPEALVRRLLIEEYEAGLGRPLVPGCLEAEEEAAVSLEEERLARPHPPAHSPPRRGAGLKVTRRVWVHEWQGRVGERRARVTARLADGRIEALLVAGAPLPRGEAERRIAELARRVGADG
jgi:lipoate-protein ligase A